jgi:hypothetical protein
MRGGTASDGAEVLTGSDGAGVVPGDDKARAPLASRPLGGEAIHFKLKRRRVGAGLRAAVRFPLGLNGGGGEEDISMKDSHAVP